MMQKQTAVTPIDELEQPTGEGILTRSFGASLSEEFQSAFSEEQLATLELLKVETQKLQKESDSWVQVNICIPIIFGYFQAKPLTEITTTD